MRKGPENLNLVQRYIKSFGEKHTVYRMILSDQKQTNICYAMTNKTPFASQLDSPRKELEDKAFHMRYMACPFEVGSFDFYTYQGKTTDRLEAEALKLMHYVEREYDMRFKSFVSDWVRDEAGTFFFIGCKSF